MWVFTKHGALSVVQDWKTPKYLWIRTRSRDHLVAFLEALPLARRRITATPNNDYAFRAKLTRGELQGAMAKVLRDIDYTNFKGALKPGPYNNACHKVWSALLSAFATGCYGVKLTLFPRAESFDAKKAAEQQEDYYGNLFEEDTADDDRTTVLHKKMHPLRGGTGRRRADTDSSM